MQLKYKFKSSNLDFLHLLLILRSNLPTMKFVCSKIKWEYNHEYKSNRRVCHCDNPCTTSSCGRMIYVYPEKNLEHTPVWSVAHKNGMALTKSE